MLIQGVTRQCDSSRKESHSDVLRNQSGKDFGNPGVGCFTARTQKIWGNMFQWISFMEFVPCKESLHQHYTSSSINNANRLQKMTRVSMKYELPYPWYIVINNSMDLYYIE
ncbi:hypothetical protein CEXT_393951 [Caerostris extrusa]|uniref:Uncharacterized protein n=1 Tax=Caerostris extrusa TaxID=172846 RepID=A0AAV4RJY7_CAEEX|nr:hypothetical protein CEXT_393951 [Caerostris extrusa]